MSRPRRGWPAWLSLRDSPEATPERPYVRSLAHRLPYVAVLLGMIAALVGAGYLYAWLGGYLTCEGLTALTMKTNTALCLTLAGIALILLVPAEIASARRWAARICAAVVLVVSLLTFVENLSGWDFGIDQLLATETPGAMGIVSPNRMGTPASLSFTLLGPALLLLSRRDRRGGVRRKHWRWRSVRSHCWPLSASCTARSDSTGSPDTRPSPGPRPSRCCYWDWVCCARGRPRD